MHVKCHPAAEGHLNCSIQFNREDLQLEYTLIGVVVHLKGLPASGKPGSPALPQSTLRIALPPHTKFISVQAELQHTEPISTEILPIAPQQPPRAGQHSEKDIPVYRRPDEEQEFYNRERAGKDQDQEDRPFVEPFPDPPFIPADAALYAEAIKRPPAQLLETTVEGLTPIAVVAFYPVRLTEEGLLEFHTQVNLVIRFEPDDEDLKQHTRTRFVSRSQAMRQIALTRLTVINRDAVVDFSDLYPIFFLGADYLIITDNRTWNAQTFTPMSVVTGDMVASFNRLAAWKRQRGIRTRVVTITEIMANRYGDFRTGSRDLQESIRNFLKMAQADWGVSWVLLGGDTSIVPIRRVASDIFGGVNRQASNPPPDNTSFWTGSYLRINAVGLGDWWGADPANLLLRPDTGMLIPYDPMGTSNTVSRGWYFTTDNTYATRTPMATNFVRVNGPASEVNADVQFLYEWNTIPTDLYYSSLVGPQYNQPGRHDWDLTNNGVYGQYGASNMDGVNFAPTVSLGRAPVSNAAGANAFVDKVIAYETFKRPDGSSLENNWTRRVVLASENWDSNWGGLLNIWQSPANPPSDDNYYHLAGSDHSLIKLSTGHSWSWSLLANVSEGDQRLIPYRTDASAGIRGWHFARSAADLSLNTRPLILPSGKIMHLIEPSLWIVVYGALADLTPAYYVLNQPGLDGSLADQEELRLQLRSEMPGFNDIKRLYQDIPDMTPAQVSAAPLEQINSIGVRNALNAGPHIVSLSGHGNSNGCCYLDIFTADNLTNGFHSFIVFADSCLTNQLDGDAVSEHLIANPTGGAVAYMGNTRFSWVGIGDDYQRRFFNQWSTLGGNAHLGLLADTRAYLYGSNDAYYRWVMFTLTLAGDPEMPLWWQEPIKFRIPEIYFWDKIKMLIDPNPPDPLDPIDLPYRRNWGLTYVHLSQGVHEELVLADAAGRAELQLTNLRPGKATISVTRAGYQPVTQQITIGRKLPKRSKSLIGAFILLLGVVAVSAALKRRY